MPRLLIFAACQKVLLSKEDNTISLISIIQQILVGLPEGAPEPPERTAIPMQWYAFSEWALDDGGDPSTVYEQQFSVYTADGEIAAQADMQEFSLKAGSHRVYAKFAAFPVWKTGKYSLNLNMRQKGESEWHNFGRYPIEVRYSHADLKLVDGVVTLQEQAH